MNVFFFIGEKSKPLIRSLNLELLDQKKNPKNELFHIFGFRLCHGLLVSVFWEQNGNLVLMPSVAP
jgi:hypothetical protein